jgi:hypothetical protein
MRRREIIVLLGGMIIFASPAFAQPARRAQKQRPSQATSQDVYVGQRRIGSDPDPSVRFEMLRQDNWRKGRFAAPALAIGRMASGQVVVSLIRRGRRVARQKKAPGSPGASVVRDRLSAVQGPLGLPPCRQSRRLSRSSCWSRLPRAWRRPRPDPQQSSLKLWAAVRRLCSASLKCPGR